MSKDKTQVGSPMNFRGMMYKPISEQGVVYLFGLVSRDLNIIVESVQVGYPDCTGLRFVGKGRWERVRIEFEYQSSNFISHGHDPKECDIIICWEDNLTKEQKEPLIKSGVEIIELKSEIGGLDNLPLEDPDSADSKEEEYELSSHIHPDWTKTGELFELIDKEIKNISPDIWRKISKSSITYYSPEKVFIYMHPHKKGIKLYLFTNAEPINNVEVPYADALKWGRIYLKDIAELKGVISIIKKSYDLINKAIKEGLNTGWFAIPERDTRAIEELKKTAEESTSGALFLSGSSVFRTGELIGN